MPLTFAKIKKACSPIKVLDLQHRAYANALQLTVYECRCTHSEDDDTCNGSNN